MTALTKGKGAAPGPIEAAPHLTNLSAAASNEHAERNADGDRLQAMRLQFALAGLSISTAAGNDFIVTGRGVCLLADPRTAWLLLRSMSGGRA